MSIAHSTWPVVLVNYNLPPWMSLKQEYFLLSLLIPGPKSPGNNIDVYLQPLVEELKEIWINGLETYDKYSDESFEMHAALMWTISDFPAYSMLSGWKTKGNFACPCCNHVTISLYLTHSKKMCYMDHRRFLDAQHPYRRNKNAFNGKIEERVSPKPISGVDALRTLLDISGKSKDHPKARFDILELGIKERLQPILSEDGKHVIIQKAGFSMSSKEKVNFCRVLKETKLPYGCSSNIARCVHSSEKKFSGYKSHDAHIFLHYLLQVAVRKSLPKHVAIPLIRLGVFLRSLCSKVIRPEDLDILQLEITETLCEFEKIFLPNFFDVMVHLHIHLVNEVKLGGPVQYRWMFFMERYLCKLKSNVRNKSRPEGFIAEGYLIEECLTFCSRYMHGVNESVNNSVEDNDDLVDRLSYIAQANEQETCLSREDIPPLIVEASTKLAAADVIDKDNGDDSDYDDTLWDWMHADEDDDN
ncbi:hypothetical protein E3N88_20305 [Mikania micrantha]|uniref:DUF4218 domain-containing protein n=1 Tax=Mikania micrantha TaxID=192012 RepID=A0A5N6NGP7_9ASTR|nr:hypothetical protein E3N88_20305 [Mikania micrantha]